jgi:hypothetical protein
MAFCTQLEWDEDFPFERYEAMAAVSGFPAGALARMVGRVGTGARIFEVWESPDDARRFGESSTALLAEFKMPMPDRTAAFELVTFEAHPSRI